MRIESIEILLRVDSAGATHELLDWAREGRIGFSVGFDLTESVREAILAVPDDAWRAVLDQDGEERETARSRRSRTYSTSERGPPARG